MKQIILLFGLLIIFNATSYAKHVDENTAKIVGQNFLATQSNSQILTGSTNLELVYKANSNASSTSTSLPQTTFFYVFNANEQGFVIVSGDDNVIPILAYSDEGVFDPDNIPPNARKWLEEYKSQIRDVIDNNILATKEIQKEWTSYINGSTQSTAKDIESVNPLVSTKWDQGSYYNALCPSNSVTGCVATAMAQIMKYWNHPATGSDFHSYNHQTYGMLSANFGSTTYDWGSMPNVVSSPNNAVATLMYQLGVSVDMSYSPEVSGAYVIQNSPTPQACSEYALKTYFGYKNTLQGIERVNYNQTQWVNILKAELDASRPILYAGFGSGGGHAFVCDGYDNNNFFHFNWGWSGAYDGYFSINALDPSGTGTGGGSGGYNSGHQAVIGIEPPSSTGSQTYALDLYNYVIPSATTIGYGNSFNISTNIANSGTTTFNGDYCAAVFDEEYIFIDYVEIKTGFSLQSGYAYTDNLVFQNAGLFSMLPGTYYVGIFYRPTGGNWMEVTGSGAYINSAQMTVINTNSIKLNSVMTVSPGTTLVQGQSISVNLNILNAGTSTFTGQYMVGLYNLDGSYVQTIDTYDEGEGLPPNYNYLSPFLTFANTITADPGTYLLAVQHKPNSSANWELTGSTSSFMNPIKIIVQAPSLQPDQYENNNTSSQAYTLPLSFSGNTATKNTVGSNLHTGTDNDYYKIDLPAGYDYTITARIHDSYNSGNGNTYSVDALLSYSTNGSTWSDAYDDIMTSSITVQNGGTVYFHIAPYFAGEMGTYLLDMTVNRTQGTVGIEGSEISDLIKVYPNPAKEFVTIDLDQFSDKVNLITLLTVQGQEVGSMNISNSEKVLRLPLEDLSAGVYFIQIHASQGILTKKIIINK